MLLKSFVQLLLATSAVAILPRDANFILPRDANAILSSLQTLSNHLTTLQNDLNSFSGGVFQIGQALQIQVDASQLVTDTNNAASTSSASTPLDDAGSRSVAFQIISIAKQIFSVLDLLDSKRAAFDATFVGTSALVKSDLQQLKTGTDSLAAALTPKLVPAVQKISPLLVSNIDFHFVRAIAIYS